MIPQNRGLLLEPIAPEDFVFGADKSLETKFKGEPLQSNADWRPFLPVEEPQAPKFETQACVSFATSNALEIILRRQFDRVHNFSDRFIATGSGTSPTQGNTPKRVADFIYRNWSVFEREWPADVSTVDEFYTTIPYTLKSLAIGRGAEFEFGYEYVNPTLPELKKALQYSPLGISVPAWHLQNELYVRPNGATDNHFVVLVHIDDSGYLYVFDTYSPYLKVCSFLPTVAMRYHLKRKVKDERSWLRFLIDLIVATFQPTTTPDAIAPTTPQKPAEPAVEGRREALHQEALLWIDKDASPLENAPDDLACAESVSALIRRVYRDFPTRVSTARLHEELKKDKRFKATLDFKPGIIVISPTVGATIGHCGIATDDQRIMSNDSATGKWMNNYSLKNWVSHFRTKKGLRVYFFEPL
jgi:hypothetical protein